MKLTIEQINKLKEYGFITQVDSSSDILSHSIDTIELGKIWKYINQTDRTEIIENWLNGGPTPPGPTPHDYSKDYLTFDILEDGYLTISAYDEDITAPEEDRISIQYKINDGDWTSYTSIFDSEFNPSDFSNLIPVTNGNKVYIKGNNNTYSFEDPNIGEEGWFFVYKFALVKPTEDPTEDPNMQYNVSGNIMSLIYGDDFIDKTEFPAESSNNFCELFESSKVIDVSNLILPATTLTPFCYGSMFDGCTSLTTAPSLPATTLDSECYGSMFGSCTSLTTAPSLPATTLASYCYSYMFMGCTSLTTAPSLPATTLVDGCYMNMFSDCTSLVIAPEISATVVTAEADGSCMAMFMGCTSLTTAPSFHITDLSGSIGCYKQMFENCTSLTTAPSLPATTLAESCYSYMFKDCTSLVTAPVISTYELPESCCEYMFQNCTSLNHVTLDIEYWANYSTYYWLDNVSPTGTFVGSAAVIDAWDASRNVSGIPVGWTAEIIQSDDTPVP